MIRKILQNAALIVASISVAVAIGDGALRWLNRSGDQQYSVAPTGNQYEFYQFDELLGWSNAPGMHGVYQRDEFRYDISINRHGMRQRGVALESAPGKVRIAFLGDSFVWGIGVSDDQRFTDIVGARPGIEALNFGVSGYAPVQYYLMIDRVIAFRPQLVVMAICSNDFADNVLYQRYGYYKPYAVLDASGQIDIRGYPIKNVKKFGAAQVAARFGWLGKSEIFRLASDYLNEKRAVTEQQGLIGFDSIYQYRNLTREAQARRQTAIEINEKLLAGIRNRLDKAGIPLVIIAAPTKFEYNPSGQYGNFIRDNQIGEILAQTASRLGIEFINTIPLLDGNDFWVHDGHWNRGGHEKMAAAINDYLVTHGNK